MAQKAVVEVSMIHQVHTTELTHTHAHTCTHICTQSTLASWRRLFNLPRANFVSQVQHTAVFRPTHPINLSTISRPGHLGNLVYSVLGSELLSWCLDKSLHVHCCSIKWILVPNQCLEAFNVAACLLIGRWVALVHEPMEKAGCHSSFAYCQINFILTG